MVRKALHHGGEDSKWWPWAVRYCNEVLRMKRVREKPSFPPFMEQVLVRKRRWKKGEMEPTMENVRYLGLSPENHGHWVVEKGESPRVTRCILTKASNPPTEGQWIALERDLLGGLTLRRRLREKTTIKHFQCLHQEQKNEERERMLRMKRIVEEETVKMVDDPPHLAILAMQVAAKLKRGLEVKEGDEEDVIQRSLRTLPRMASTIRRRGVIVDL